MVVITRVVQLCEITELAFDQTPNPGTRDEDISRTPADEGVADYFRGKSWHNHTTMNLRHYSCALAFFTVKAFRYYLPAFMLAELKDPETADVIRLSIACRLQAADAHEILSTFSDAELSAIAAFLEECIRRYDDIGGYYGRALDSVRMQKLGP